MGLRAGQGLNRFAESRGHVIHKFPQARGPVCTGFVNVLDSRAASLSHPPFSLLEKPMLTDDLHSDAHALLPGRTTESGATRRTALQTALGLGYAAAAAPIMA